MRTGEKKSSGHSIDVHLLQQGEGQDLLYNVEQVLELIDLSSSVHDREGNHVQEGIALPQDIGEFAPRHRLVHRIEPLIQHAEGVHLRVGPRTQDAPATSPLSPAAGMSCGAACMSSSDET